MAIITDIKLQKSKTRANIYIDHNFCCGLDLATILKNKLKVGSDITEEALLKIQKEAEMHEATEKALSLLERQKYTKQRLSLKLKEKGYMDELVEEVIEKLSGYGYVNNIDYIKSFIQSHPNKSRKEIERDLYAKGVSRNEIEEYYNLQEETASEQDKCDTVAEKYMKNKEKNEANAKKLLSHLMYKGFSYGDAKSSLSKIFDIEVNDD